MDDKKNKKEFWLERVDIEWETSSKTGKRTGGVKIVKNPDGKFFYDPASKKISRYHGEVFHGEASEPKTDQKYSVGTDPYQDDHLEKQIDRLKEEANYYREQLNRAHGILGRVVHQLSERWDSVNLTEYFPTDNLHRKRSFDNPSGR